MNVYTVHRAGAVASVLACEDGVELGPDVLRRLRDAGCTVSTFRDVGRLRSDADVLRAIGPLVQCELFGGGS